MTDTRPHKPYLFYDWVILIGCVVLLGLQSLRVLLTSATWGFSREQEILFNLSPVSLFFIILLIVLSPLFILKRIRWAKLPDWMFWGGIVQALLRVVEQVVHFPIYDFILASFSVIAFVLFFAVVYQVARSRFILRGRDMALGITLGVLFDTVIRASLWTLDLSWRSDGYSFLFVVLVALIVVYLSLRLRAESCGRVTGPIKNIARGGLALGPYIFINQHLFSDFSRLLVQTNWPFPLVAGVLILGNLVGLSAVWLSVAIYRKIPRGWMGYWGILFVCLACLTVLPGISWLYVLAVFGMQFVGNVIFALILEFVFVAPGHGSLRLIRRNYILGFMVYIGALAGYYGTGTSAAFFPIMALIIAFIAYLSADVFALREPIVYVLPSRDKVLLGLSGLVLVLGVPIGLWRANHLPAPPELSGRELRLMSFNTHQGTNAIGQIVLEDQAQFVLDRNIDLVGLNEVSRGWLVNGGVDMPVYLSHRTGYYSLFGPSVGLLQGNGFLSRYPLEEPSNYIYQNRSPLFARSFLQANLNLGAAPISVVVTHLSWDSGSGVLKQALDPSWSGTEDPIRDAQALELVEHGRGEAPMIIMGDMNTNPESKTMGVFQAHGFQDVVATADCSNQLTYWSLDPFIRLDYVLAAGQFNILACQIPQVNLSDHLPVIVTVELPGESQ